MFWSAGVLEELPGGAALRTSRRRNGNVMHQ
jgi:hypothetical protein